MKLAVVASLATGVATAKDLSLTWKDCGGPNTKAKITGFSPNSVTLGQKTTVTGKGDLSEAVDSATFDLTMTGAIGQLLHCSGDASVSKTCSLPLGSGSLTFEGMKFPISAGTVPVNVDLALSAALPGPLTKTKTIAKASAKNGDELFCMEIDSAPADDSKVMEECQTYRRIENGACGDICLGSTIGVCPRSIVVTTGQLEAGACKDAGYTVDKGEQDTKAGPCGTLKIEKWGKSTMVDALSTDLATIVAARDLSLTWKDCGGPNTKAKITGFSPNSVTLGQKTTVTGKGDLSEAVDSATFDLTMSGAIGQLLHCSGDASVSKTCSLPLGSGSLTFEGMKFPISAGTVPVNVDLALSAALPGPLTKTKTIAKASAKNGDELFCMEIDSAPADDSKAMEECQTYRRIANGACGDVCLGSTIGVCPRSIVVTTGQLEAGACKDAGYTVDKGEQDTKAGPCGTLKIEKWGKSTMVDALSTDLATIVAARDLSLTWKDCGGPNTKAKITGFSPNSITLGQKTTVTGKGDLSEAVDSATFDLTMTGAIGQLLHCSGDASVSKTCSLPLGSGSLTFQGMKFPISAGTVPVNVDLALSAALPGPLTKTKTIAKATAKNGDELFCMEIDSAPATKSTIVV